ncbi:MAG: aminotransferase class III-fold pyridoxal phosphate-dependent enzyme [Alphaproteobacteria bacterium]|nr:aminotransferase class III-fold pyridoxal phosphate-dependent enzyme [Alphaproteobacteria bacterium]MBU1512975.1 aminotransferase class III-fold pyridoxal phosphate-dependent enzyme [Alphaproteobacteria bacterium]MBU2094851.1 aminotransferase class III-fold pyridoxal phosphate-dependent enzyme [Alphaproteobacteria bacterium]MBU2152757.1 aminotransferase class III-fold pyridoxal phosphate-dependent enzyme [Alphaproteobacteria bacterium]MBU2306334.1 aminotransferase class III-fold pyridoxal ph
MDRTNSRDRALRERAAAVIPGGMYGHQSVGLLPDDYPQFFERGEGAHLWDADGNRYLDYMCAYGPNLFGYANPEIDAAYVRQLEKGDTLTGPTGLMVELAEALTGMVSHADWAIFCKNGTDATTMALTTARAHTKRRIVIRAKGAYHGAAPWCVPRPSGVIDSDRANQLFYDYNDVASLEAAVAEAGDDLAAIFAAPFKHDAFIDQVDPDPAYARRARELCDQTGALLIVDEVRAGFRLSRDCSWSRIGVAPDLSTWGKCLANGHPLSVMLGNDKARAAAASIYVTGSFWYQAATMAAALETLRLVRDTDYLERITALGDTLRTGLDERAKAAGFGFRQSGPGVMPLFLFDDDPDLRKGFCWSSEMLSRGVYVHPWHNMFLCAAMTPADIAQTLDAAEGAFGALKSQVRDLSPVEKLAFLSAGAR